jgi:hypothetical protein
MRAQAWITGVGYILVMGATLGSLWMRESAESPLDAASIAESERRGQQIASALEHFHSAHSKYPSELNELVPWYLNDVPRPAGGTKRWVYHSGSESFVLAFGSSGGGRDGLKGAWYLEEGEWRSRP